MNLYEWYQEAHQALALKGIETAQLDAKFLLMHVLQIDTNQFWLQKTRDLSLAELEVLKRVLQRRLNFEPVSKITGQKEFWGYDFQVSKDTLDPRPDSETLIEAVLGQVPADFSGLMLDLGTGSGCLILTLLKELTHARAIAVDQSEAALSLAQINAKALGVENRVEFVQSSWTQNLDPQLRFDLIISNPPYIPTAEIEHLSPEVRDNDPLAALDGGESGFGCFELILEQIKPFMTPQTLVFLECGAGQMKKLVEIALGSGYKTKEIYKDLLKIDRILSLQLV